ncbi:YhfT family protein [Tepidanaerobacter sp. GT38]|uniref:YhfT family protein n=1 Tax=Tepidanaerobacter sp. GT38 TaxID=2722793 RepID=UPI001F17455B|nr:YhfT family protein [Tepidanaerobacter sp. GT38]MCG1012398.1 YhfT family protein [Tepidanaerobacter sp. GT38]
MSTFVIAAIGALASILANRGIAVFNDGLRPIMPEHIEGRMSKAEIASTSFAMGFGLVIGFGIPVSIGAAILLIHSILLATDIIGTWVPKGAFSDIIAGLIGALYGVGLLTGLQWIVNIFQALPVNVFDAMGAISSPVIMAFAAFPALAVALQQGVKKGVITLAISGLVRVLIVRFSPLNIGNSSISLNPDGMAMLAGMIILLTFASREKSEEETGLAAIFSDRVARIKKNVWILAVMGALVAMGTALHILAGDPISLNLVKEMKYTDAAMAALARAIGFVPLVATTAITTGVYGPVGMTFIFAVALFANNPFIAAALGFVIIVAEVYLLSSIASFLDKFPGIRKSADSIRTAMSQLLEIALLVGGINAANQMIAGLGVFLVIGLYLLNEAAGRPIVRMAIGPVGAILVGIIVNILAAIGLYIPPAA